MTEDKINSLSVREKEVLSLVSKGYNNNYIANKLCVQPCTIKKTVIHIYNKLGLPIKGNTINRVLATLMFNNINLEKSNEITEENKCKFVLTNGQCSSPINKRQKYCDEIPEKWCYYKQLKRLEQEHNTICYNLGLLEQENEHYKSALKEIWDIVKCYEDLHGFLDCTFEVIEKEINEVLNEN